MLCLGVVVNNPAIWAAVTNGGLEGRDNCLLFVLTDLVDVLEVIVVDGFGSGFTKPLTIFTGVDLPGDGGTSTDVCFGTDDDTAAVAGLVVDVDLVGTVTFFAATVFFTTFFAWDMGIIPTGMTRMRYKLTSFLIYVRTPLKDGKL